MIIAYGDGRNGKSTFWNTVARVLGGYAGNVSADTLTVGCRRNVKPELAELKGVRLALAKELEEGTRMNTSVVKQLTSTDDIYGEKKFCKINQRCRSDQFRHRLFNSSVSAGGRSAKSFQPPVNDPLFSGLRSRSPPHTSVESQVPQCHSDQARAPGSNYTG